LRMAHPRITFVNLSRDGVSAEYADLPVGSRIVFVNQTTGQEFGSGGFDAGRGGFGMVVIEVPAGMQAGEYYLKAKSSTGDYLAQSVMFHIAKSGGHARA
jgi:hypothetical protein